MSTATLDTTTSERAAETPVMLAVSYLRVSTREQAERGRRMREGLGHRPHGTVPAGGDHDVGAGLDGPERLTGPGVLDGCLKDQRRVPPGVGTRLFHEGAGRPGLELDRVEHQRHLLRAREGRRRGVGGGGC